MNLHEQIANIHRIYVDSLQHLCQSEEKGGKRMRVSGVVCIEFPNFLMDFTFRLLCFESYEPWSQLYT